MLELKSRVEGLINTKNALEVNCDVHTGWFGLKTPRYCIFGKKTLNITEAIRKESGHRYAILTRPTRDLPHTLGGYEMDYIKSKYR